MMRQLMLMVASGMLTAVAANAQTAMPAMGHDMEHMTVATKTVTTSSTVTTPAVSESTQAFMAADAKMHKAMMTGYTGDADVDFLRGMIPHHQGAIDMANIVLKYGTDPEVRMLAGDIVKAQEIEIRTMQAWLAKHGPKDATAGNARAVVPATLPVSKAVVKMVSTTTVVTGTATSATTILKAKVSMVSASIPANLIPQPSLDKSVNNVPVPTIPVAEINAAAAGAISMTMPVSSSIPDISGTTAGSTQMMMDGMPMSMTPDMPAPDASISNQAPQMELLDQPLTTKIGDATGENNAAQ